MTKTRSCTKCNKNYNRTSEYFYRNKRSKDGLNYQCKKCQNEYRKKLINKPENRKKVLEYYRKRNLKDKFNMTLKDYDKMFEEQKGCCLICGRHRSEFKKRLAVDHDHKTGKIRGLLCHICNKNLGWYEKHKNNVNKYLKKNE